MMNAPSVDPKTIKTQWHDLKTTSRMRARDAAAKIGVSEAELVAAQVGDTATRLRDDYKELFAELPSLGEVMALTRNEACVHERKGVYLGAKFFEQGPMKMGLLANADIDLRLFMAHWRYAFACKEPVITQSQPEGTGKFKRSLQFFDKAGMAIHKIHLMDNSDTEAFDRLVSKFAAEDQPTHIAVESYAPKAADKPDGDIDWENLRKDWLAMTDVHQFHGMLRKYGVGREQSFRHIGEDLAYQVALDSPDEVLKMVRDGEYGMMVFVGNRGCIQIHTGPVHKVMTHGSWYNVLDPMFNLHLNADHIASCWVVKKPTSDGTVTALEIFDADSEIIATFFGARKPGQKELEPWRATLNSLKHR